jgi:hypothetical protein
MLPHLAFYFGMLGMTLARTGRIQAGFLFTGPIGGS